MGNRGHDIQNASLIPTLEDHLFDAVLAEMQQ